MARKHGHFLGHEKEPSPLNKGHDHKGRPLVHSHSRRPKRHIKGTGIKAGGKR